MTAQPQARAAFRFVRVPRWRYLEPDEVETDLVVWRFERAPGSPGGSSARVWVLRVGEGRVYYEFVNLPRTSGGESVSLASFAGLPQSPDEGYFVLPVPD